LKIDDLAAGPEHEIAASHVGFQIVNSKSPIVNAVHMTCRLYYTEPALTKFEAEVTAVFSAPRPGVILNRTAFYPTSGGQSFDMGWLSVGSHSLRVVEVGENEDDSILHFIEGELVGIATGAKVQGLIDLQRRRDHMQQHSGQHVLSAAFMRLFDMHTVSFHMGTESCTIDLATSSVSPEQVKKAEELADQVVFEDRPVQIRFVKAEQAQDLGLRKIPQLGKNELRLIDIQDFDLTACGGTHVARTGEIGAILLRKTERTKQGVRVEFVCGTSAIRTARKDYESLNEAAALFSAHLWDVPQQIRKSLEEAKTDRKGREMLLEELAQLHADKLLAEIPEHNGFRLLSRIFPDRDLAFIKLVAQKATRSSKSAVALLGCSGSAPGIVFAQTSGLPFDMSTLMKTATAALGGRGGGTKDMAQGGAPESNRLEEVIAQAAAQLRS